jgi:hypothetical protein
VNFAFQKLGRTGSETLRVNILTIAPNFNAKRNDGQRQ